MTEQTIPFNLALPVGREFEYMQAAIANGHISMTGPFTEMASALLEELLGAESVVLTTSCTDALELAALLLDIKAGDVVIVPSFTFVSTALAFVRTGATLRFCDIEPSTLGMDPNHLSKLMDENVKAVVPVHYAGIACDILGIQKVLENWPSAELVEDNAHGLFGLFRDRPLGSFGRMSTLSFHETKNFVCGEGGALVLNESADIERARTLRDKGTNRSAFLDGSVDKYTWVDTGSSFGMSDLLAAYLLAQLEAREEILAQRQTTTILYQELLEPISGRFGFDIPHWDTDRTSAYHMFHLIMRDQEQRDRAISGLAAVGIRATFHYVPLHSSPAAAQYVDHADPCPVTDEMSARLLRLPFYNSLRPQDVDLIVKTLARTLADPGAAGPLTPESLA